MKGESGKFNKTMKYVFLNTDMDNKTIHRVFPSRPRNVYQKRRSSHELARQQSEQSRYQKKQRVGKKP